MTRVHALGALAALAMLPGCPTEPISCTTEARSSVSVTVVDPTGSPVADADVAYSVDGGAEQACEAMTGSSFVCGWEVAGEFAITADAWGFAPTTAEVTVGEDECHVITETVELVLEPVACTDEAVPSVRVTVTDVQGADVTTADVVWNMADEDDLPEACVSIGGNQWVCGYEVAGDIRIDITNAGPYLDYSEVVTVDADECHVLTEELAAVLEYLPD